MQRTSELHVPFADEHTRIRVLDPIGSGVNPALVYLHGGGWTMFSIDTHDRLMREYAQRAGAVVIAVDYALSPEAKFPKALEQTAAVVRWLCSNGKSLGIDPDRIAIGGDSAGANLAVATALTLRNEGAHDALRGMLLAYGVFDSGCSTPSYSRFGGAGYMLGDQEMLAFWRNYLEDAAHRVNPLASPLLADLSGLPAAFLTVADCDVLHDENVAMAGRLRQFGVPVESHVYPGTTHSFLEAVSVSRLADRAVGDGARWLRRILAGD